MWREMISRLTPDAEIARPAGGAVVDGIEERLGQVVPAELRALLLEVDGVADEYGTDVVWSAQRIADENWAFRVDPDYSRLYVSFSSLMFFGDNGGGDQFAFMRSPDRSDVFVWDHETDERRIVAHSLEEYLVKSLEADGEDWYRP